MNNRCLKSVLKTLSWRMIATSATLLFASVLTGQLNFIQASGIPNVLLKTIFFVLRERP